jgi:hypothetical protein
MAVALNHGKPMKTRLPVIACCMVAAALSAGCAAVYKNTSACEQMMRQSASEVTAADTLSISHAGAGINGSRVVVEGTLAHPQTASEATAARPPNTNIIEAGLLAPVAAAIQKSKPPKTVAPAAVECTFDANGLSAFRWLSPPRLAKPATASGEEEHSDN